MNRLWRFALAGEYLGLVLVLVLLVVLFGSITEHFFSLITFRTIANQIPDAVIIATGMTFVLIIGGIDLSVGSVLGLSAAVLGVAMVQYQLPLVVAMPVAMGTGLAAGLLNGLITVKWRLPSFIVTLGMLEAARGAAYLVASSKTQYIGAPVEVLLDVSIFGLGLPFAIALLVVIAGQVLLQYTQLGRRMLALGGNEESARLSGLRITRIRLFVFSLAGCLSGLAAVIHCARLSAADPNAGIGYELNAIAAVVIGGTSLMGGRGSVLRTFLGVLIIAVLASGLAQVGAQEPTKRIVTGAVIVLAVILDYYRHRKRDV